MAEGNGQKGGKPFPPSQTFVPQQGGQQAPPLPQSQYGKGQQPYPTQKQFAGQQRIKQQPPTWAQSIQQLNRLLTTAKETVIILRPNPGFDSIVSGLALKLALEKIGRHTHIVGSTPIDPSSYAEKVDNEYDILEGIDGILPTLPKAQLNVTISYNKGSFSQGNMNTTKDGLILTMSPEKGGDPIEPLNIESRNIAVKPDTIFLLGIENLSHLQEMYQQNQQFFKKFPTINVDYHKNNARYGTVNLIDPKAKSLAEMVTLMLYDLRFVFDRNIAKKLHAGIKEKTNNFSQDFFSPNMLEAVSICMRYQQKPKPKFIQ